ncbi:amino acid adenylation domain-containing protein [Streptomyces sp. NPDC050548]|uniref:amino acid adenylation domain-containing protein n=1 Tax=Streptomyces sp. NPDC050548 TaxID=3365629 RepID=UPI00378C82F4
MDSPAPSYDPTVLPGDFLRTPASGGAFGSAWRPVESHLLSAVAESADQTSSSARCVLTAAALVALADFSGCRELCVGTPALHPDGPTGGLRPLSTRLDDQDTLRTISARVSAGLGQEDPNGGSFTDDPSETPCPTVIAVDQNITDIIAPLPELVVAFELRSRTGRLTVHYAADLYESATATQLADHVLACLDALLTDVDRPVAAAMRPAPDEALTFLPAPQPAPDPDELSMPGDLVRTWAERTPDGIAILAADGATLTYARLDALAGGLAERLSTVANGSATVAVLTGDSRTAAIAMVACQYADRCFVVLDPEAAEARNAALVTTARAGVLLHDAAGGGPAARLAEATGSRTLLYEESGRTAATAQSPPPRRADREPAYIAFTSGTTGKPKGVVQPRRSLAQFIAWQQAQLGLGPGSRVAMWSAPVFDACYMEVFGALAYGATLCVPPQGERRDPEAVAAWLAAARVTFFQGVPSFVEYVVAALENRPRPMTALENVIVAGEVFPPSLGVRMRAVFPSARVHNMFGPTECVLATRHEIPPDHPGHRRVPVGRPISGRRILLMDTEGRPVPRGAVGEIGIVGRFLASGYIGDEVQTRSRFRPLPDRTDEVVYHTGDFGRIGPDGTLRYLGRRDAQIKVRGIRVNLDEIEAVLSRQPQVEQCKVVDVRVAAGHVQLVAFVQPKPELSRPGSGCALAEPALASVLRRSVTEALGARVAPTRYIVAGRLPRTATDKPDLDGMRKISEELRAARTAVSVPGSAVGPDFPESLRDRIRRVVLAVTGRPVRDDEDLLTTAADPLLLALRMKKALMAHCPGVFDRVDVRAHSSIEALEDIAARSTTVAPTPRRDS